MDNDIKLRIMADSAYFPEVKEGAGKGLHIIANGWTISCQAGWGNYCDSDPTRSGEDLSAETLRENCEIAVWPNKTGKMLRIGNDTVLGWTPWDMVFDLIEWIRKSKNIPKEGEVLEKINHLIREYKHRR